MSVTITIRELAGDEQVWGPFERQTRRDGSEVTLLLREQFGADATFVADSLGLNSETRLYGQIGRHMTGAGHQINMVTGRVRIDIERDEDGEPAPRMLPHYSVEASAWDGEWLGEPVATGEMVNSAEWATRGRIIAADYEEIHDTYEHGSPGDGTQETRAITVRYVG